MSDRTKAPATRRSARKPVRRRVDTQPGEDMRDLVSQLKRDRIVAAAIELFYRQGYVRTTLDQVAASLGVTKPFIYQFFKSKNALLAEISSRAILDAHHTLNRTVTQQGTAAEKLRTIVADFTRNVLDHQANALIYSREENELEPDDRERIKHLRRDFDHRLVGLLKEGVANGEFVIQDLRLAALAIGSIVAWSAVWFRPGGRLSKQEAADGVATLVLSMVGCPQPVPAPVG